MLMPYFGTWPPWINFFMESCRRNPDVVWRFHTDCGRPENLPDNVEIVETTFGNYTALVSARLKLSFAPADPYKLCDLRPALGYIHAAETAGYAFYGFGDIDVIYGQISSFYPEHLRRRYTVISTHGNDASGHFCLFRNNAANRSMFRFIRDFGRDLADPRNHAIDERGLTRTIRRSRRWRTALDPRRWLSGGVWPRPFYREEYSTVLSPRGWIDGSANYPRVWRWRDGALTADGTDRRTFLYLHFMRWKSHCGGTQPDEGAWRQLDRLVNTDWRRAIADGFSISPAGFQPFDFVYTQGPAGAPAGDASATPGGADR